MFLVFLTLIYSAGYCIKYSGKQICYKMQKLNGLLYVEMTSNVNGFSAFGVGTGMQGDVVIVWVGPDRELLASNRLATGYALTSYYGNSKLVITHKKVNNDTSYEIHFNRPLLASDGFSSKVDTFFMSALKLDFVNTTDPTFDFPKHDFAKNFQYFVASTEVTNTTSNAAAKRIVSAAAVSLFWKFVY